MKRALCLVFALLLTFSLTGCNPTRTISSIELTMEVPEDMKDVSQNEDVLGYGFNFAMENDELFICGLRQDMSDIENGRTMTLEEYTHQLIQLYGLEGRVTHGERKSRGYMYLRFTIPLESGINEYLCGAYRCDGAFWLIQMNGLTKNFDEATWYEYLDSVEFSTN